MTQKKESISQRQLRERDHQKVKGIFRNLEQPGAPLRFPFRKYKEDGVKWYTFNHGEEYEIPFMVYEHLNKKCFNTISNLSIGNTGSPAMVLDHMGRPLITNEKQEHRFAFSLTSFKKLKDFDMEMKPEMKPASDLNQALLPQ